MKKLVRVIFILTLFILMIIESNVYATTPTLEQISNTFNNCSTVKEYATYGSTWTATYSDNKLTISVTANDISTNLEYTLEESILNANFSGDDVFTGLMVTTVLTDSIGQLHGYSDGELLGILNSEEISSYSVENEGYEVKELSDGSYQIKIDINKKIPLNDMSNVYIEVSDLEDLKSFISGDGSAEKNKGNIWFNKSGFDGENTLLIAEKEELTENAYKSILSIIEVMFNSNKASDYFKSNYSGISVGNKEFTGFKIEINPTKTELEERLIPSDRDYKFARITIDKNLVNSAINGTNNTENDNEDKKTDNNSGDINKESASNIKDETNNAEKDDENKKTNNNSSNINKADNTQSSGKLPQTGESMIIIFAILLIILIATISCKKYYNYKDIK